MSSDTEGKSVLGLYDRISSLEEQTSKHEFVLQRVVDHLNAEESEKLKSEKLKSEKPKSDYSEGRVSMWLVPFSVLLGSVLGSMITIILR